MLSVKPQGGVLSPGAASALAGGHLVLPRALRRPARALAHLFSPDVTVPRYAGAALVFGMLGATGLYGAVLGGHMPAIVQTVTSASGFALATVNVTGNSQTSEIDILGAIGLNGHTSLIGFDAEAARERIAALPWIQSVTVRKVYPATIDVMIEERRPFAIWQHGRELTIVDRHGQAIAPYPGVGLRSLPLVVGYGAAEQAADFVDRIAAYPQVASHVVGYMRVADRRWDLRLDSGVTVLLPEQGEADALSELSDLDREQGILTRDVETIDLRLPDRIAIGLSADAAKARQAALKERGVPTAKERRT